MNFHSNIIGVGWSDARVIALQKLCADGLSASQIAGELGGVSRSGVIGKVHRMGLRLLGSAGPRKTDDEKRAARRLRRSGTPLDAPRRRKGKTRYLESSYVPKHQYKSPERTAARMAEVDEYRERFICETTADLTPEQLARTVKLVELRPNTCRWPYGSPDKPDFCFCGDQPIGDSPYCAPHHRLAHQRPQGASA